MWNHVYIGQIEMNGNRKEEGERGENLERRKSVSTERG